MSKSRAAFTVNKNRVEKVTLPPASQWRVASEDVLISGSLTSTIRRKTLLFTRTSTVTHRQMTVTKQGYMVIYDSDEKGYVINLKDAAKMKTSTMALMRKTTTDDTDWNGFFDGAKRTQIEIKMRWGAVLMSVLSKDAVDWIQALSKFVANGSNSNWTKKKTITSQPLPDEESEDVLKTTRSQSMTSSVEEVSIREMKKKPPPVPKKPMVGQPAIFLSCPDFAKPSPWRRPASPLPPTTTFSDPTADFSVRQGQHSVATLRNILERKATRSLTGEKRRHTLHGC